MPKISVIIPVYNVEPYLRECLDSVINQTLKDIEIICINDGSTDSSLDILNEYKKKDNRIIVITQENQGAAIARNNGMEQAKGDYLSILDSDDIFHPNMLEKLYTKAINTNSDIVICRSNNIDDKTGKIEPMDYSIKNEYLPEKDVFNYKDIPKHIYGFCVGWSWDKLYKKEFVKKHNLQFQNLRSTNDMFFVFYSLVLAERICTIDDYLINHRYNINSQLSETRDKDPLCFIKAIEKLQNTLINMGIYKDVEQSFFNWTIDFCFWQYNTLTQKRNKNLLIKKLIEYVFPMLNTDKYNIDYYYNTEHFYKIRELSVITKYRILTKLFFIYKNTTHITITILGIKLKIRRHNAKS